MRQFVGSIRDHTTVRELLLGVSPPEIRDADARLVAAERAADDVGNARGRAFGSRTRGRTGATSAATTPRCCGTRAPSPRCALRSPTSRRGPSARCRVASRSGWSSKRCCEVTPTSCVLDEPDNYLDVPGKRWLEEWLRQTTKTVLFVSHDRELLEQSGAKVVTLEGRGAWTHGATFATWNEAREDRLARIDDEHRRWQEERKHLEEQIRELRRRSQVTDAFASRLRARRTRSFAATTPPRRGSARRTRRSASGSKAGAPASARS